MTRRTLLVPAALLPLLLLGAPLAAGADDTTVSGSVGVNTVSARPAVAVAWGRSGEFIGVEVEFADTIGAGTDARHSVGTISGMLFVQTPAMRNDIQLFAGAGLGLYGETAGPGGGGSGEVGAKILGAGVKLPVAGPLKLRFDYRFFWGDAPDASRTVPKSIATHRVSVGISLSF